MKNKTKYYFSIFLILIQIMSLFGFSYAMPQDVQNHWAQPQIEKYIGQDVIIGYNDNTFKPDNFITRAEFITILNKYFGFEELAEIGFLDVSEKAWYKAQIQKAIKQGYISGYDDNRFRPDEYISRHEAAAIIAKILNLDFSIENNEVKIFSDWSSIPSWSMKYVNALVKYGLMKGYPDNSIKYDRYLTRAEALILLDKMESHIKQNVPKISSVKLTNGTVMVSFDKNVTNLSVNDLKLNATLDGTNYSLTNLSFDAATNTFTFSAISRTSFTQELRVDVSSKSDKISGSASATIEIPRTEKSSSRPSVPNEAPSTPVITRTPSGNVSPSDEVTITATSTDPEGDAITYVWEGRLAETSTYPLGKQVVTVKAVDSHGNESQQAAIVFFVMDTTTGSGGVLLTNVNSRIYENGIDGATITHFTFNVPSVWGHSGSDYAWVRGLNVNTQQWEYVPNGLTNDIVYVSNGVYLEAELPAGTYSRLEFFYYASHCMYGQSNITYSVDFSFADLDPGVPAESAPTASDVTISGVPKYNEALTGMYQYSDANGDLEGYVDSIGNISSTSLYQWYRSEDASGTGKTAISGATNVNYTVTSDDAGKYLSFEVTPQAITGVDGTLIGSPVESSLLYILNDDAEILDFTVPGQTADPAVIDNVGNTITLVVESTTAVNNLIPTITLSSGATVVPASLTPTDFTLPVPFTVTSEDGLNAVVWTVTITVAPPL